MKLAFLWHMHQPSIRTWSVIGMKCHGQVAWRKRLLRHAGYPRKISQYQTNVQSGTIILEQIEEYSRGKRLIITLS
jgi:alpha-amylase/alpha-mannosidase (GH57 family)